MHIGRLDRIVTIESYTMASNQYSSKRIKTWTTYKSGVPASKDYRSGSGSDEMIEADQRVSVSGGIWVIRYDSGVTDKMRILYDSKYYYIVRVKEIGRGRGMELTTELRDNE